MVVTVVAEVAVGVAGMGVALLGQTRGIRAGGVHTVGPTAMLFRTTESGMKSEVAMGMGPPVGPSRRGMSLSTQRRMDWIGRARFIAIRGWPLPVWPRFDCAGNTNRSAYRLVY